MPVDNELYNRLSATWWDENTVPGSMRTGLNPARLEVPGAQFLPSYAANPTMINLISCQLALIGILGLAIVPAIAQLVQSENEGWVRWTSSLDPQGWFGYAAIGLWIGVMSLLALRSNLLLSPLACLGLVVAISFILHIPLLLIVVAAAQPITMTIWYFWTGIVLLHPTPSRLMQPTFTSVQPGSER